MHTGNTHSKTLYREAVGFSCNIQSCWLAPTVKHDLRGGLTTKPIWTLFGWYVLTRTKFPPTCHMARTQVKGHKNQQYPTHPFKTKYLILENKFDEKNMVRYLPNF